jgi:hypothetical protein
MTLFTPGNELLDPGIDNAIKIFRIGRFPPFFGRKSIFVVCRFEGNDGRSPGMRLEVSGATFIALHRCLANVYRSEGAGIDIR